jgi:HD-like signal output (HDOD) protein
MTELPSSESSSNLDKTAEQFVEKLRNALRKDGDFPASAKIVSELRMLTSDPRTTANQITEVILREPSLGTRVLHLVNSSFYRRAKPIMTVSQAVVQIGMKPLAELCAGLVLLQKFVPTARRGGAFANCLQKTILTSLLSSSLSSEAKNSGTASAAPSKSDECGFLAGSFAELGTLLLAYYFPQVYDSALKRAEQKRVDLQQAIREITGLSPLQLSLEVVNALDLPEFYRNVLQASLGKATESAGTGLPTERLEIARVAKSVQSAQDISDVLVTSKNQQDLERVLASVKANLNIATKAVERIVGELPQVFKKQCECIELTLPALPPFVSTYLEPDKAEGAAAGKKDAPGTDEFMQYVDEIRQAVESGESTASIITTVMETLAWNLRFDRVLLLLLGSGRKRLAGRMLLVKTGNLDPRKIERPLDAEASPRACDAQAFKEGRSVFRGDPVLEGGWPIVAIPIGFGQRAIGVIYADRAGENPAELSEREQAAIAVLAELLDRSVGMSP